MITTTESMRKQPWLCVLCFAFYAGLATGTCPENEYIAQTQKYKVEFENDASWKYSDFATYTQTPMLDRESSMLTKEELFDFIDNSGQTTFPVVGADEWTTVIDYENGDPPSYVRWYQVGTAGGSGYKSMSSWKTYSQGGGTGITALETNYGWLGYNFRWKATTCDGGGVSCHAKVVTECESCPSGTTSPAGSTSSDACSCPTGTFGSPGAVVAFNPTGTEATFVRSSSQQVDLGTVSYNIETNGGITLITKFMFSGATNGNYERIFGAMNAFDSDVNSFFLGRKSTENTLLVQFGDSSGVHCKIDDIVIAQNTQYSAVITYKTSTNTVAVKLGDQSPVYKQCAAEYNLPDFTVSHNKLGAPGYSNTDFFSGTVDGLYVFSRFLGEDEAAQVLAAIEIGGPDTLPTLQCTSCPSGMTSPPLSTSISACGCQAGSFGTTPVMHFFLTGALSDTIAGQVITHDTTKQAVDFTTDISRGQVLDLTSSESGKFVLNSAVASGILDGSVWTMSVWFKPVAQSQRVPILVRYDKDYTPRGGFEIHYETNKNIIFMRYDGATVYEITSATTANEWTHLTFVSSEKAISLYIDGQLTDEKICATCVTTWEAIQATNHILGVGTECHADQADSNACPDYKAWHDYAGYLQDLRIHDRALTAAEIQALVRAPADSVCASCPGGMTSPAGSTTISACACADNQQTVAFKNDKLQAWYKLESDALDSGPHAAHLQTRLSATANFVSGQYLSVSDDVSFLIPREKTGLIIPAGTTALTVSFWVKNWIDGYVMRWVTSNLYFWENSDTSKVGEASVEGSTLTTLFTQSSEWKHMLFVFDQTQILFYENGVIKDQSTTAKIPAGGFVQETDKDAGLFCNPYSASKGHDFRGDIKDVRFYLTAFTSAEAQNLYAGVGSCLDCPTDGTVVEGCQPPCVDGTYFSYWSIRKSACP